MQYWLMLMAFWVVAAMVVGYVAEQRGRDKISWVALSFVLSPLFAILAVGALPELAHSEEHTRSKSAEGLGTSGTSGVAATAGLAEVISTAALEAISKDDDLSMPQAAEVARITWGRRGGIRTSNDAFEVGVWSADRDLVVHGSGTSWAAAFIDARERLSAHAGTPKP